MEHDYYTNRLNIHIAQPSESRNILDFHLRNRDYFKPFEPRINNSFYTENFQRSNIAAESVSFIEGSFIRYYLFKIGCISRPIGTISFKQKTRNNNPIVLVGYKIDHDEWRKGYAYEALNFILPRIVLSYSSCRIEALVQPSNTASVNLLQKLGFVQDENEYKIICEANGKSLPHTIYHLPTGIHQ